MSRVELRDHSKPCEHSGDGRIIATEVPMFEGYSMGSWLESDVWMCSVYPCPGGALRVFEFDGSGTVRLKGMSNNGRVWQRWVEWLDDERTT